MLAGRLPGRAADGRAALLSLCTARRPRSLASTTSRALAHRTTSLQLVEIASLDMSFVVGHVDDVLNTCCKKDCMRSSRKWMKLEPTLLGAAEREQGWVL